MKTRLLALAINIPALLLLWCSMAIAATPTEVDCSGTHLPDGMVMLYDPSTTKCYPEISPPGAPGIVWDNFEGSKATYSASVQGLATAVTATDVVVLQASATKTVRVDNILIACDGTANTVPLLIDFYSTLNTGGTSAAMVAVPHDSSDGAATATALSYTANPTLGTLVGPVRAALLYVSTTTAVLQKGIGFTFGVANEKTIVLKKGSTQQLSINFSATTIVSPVCAATIEWTEE